MLRFPGPVRMNGSSAPSQVHHYEVDGLEVDRDGMLRLTRDGSTVGACPVHSLEQLRFEHISAVASRAGTRWHHSELLRLAEERRRMPIAMIARSHRRTEGAIRRKLSTLPKLDGQDPLL